MKQESLYVWGGYGPKEKVSPKEHFSGVSAFTASELGEMLPRTFTKDGEIYYPAFNANGNGLNYIDYETFHGSVGVFLHGYPLIKGDNEADARAAMLTYLLENNLC